MKRVFLIHGWEGNPENAWFPWLKKKLEKNGFEVIAPEMPNTENPKLNLWLERMKEIASDVSEKDYFVGHSLGCITIVRHLMSLEKNKKVGGCIFVAGFSFLQHPEIKDFYKKDLKVDYVKEHCNTFINIYSDNDIDVSAKQSLEFAKQLNAKIIVEHGKGHFSDDAGIKELPIVLEEILRISKK